MPTIELPLLDSATAGAFGRPRESDGRHPAFACAAAAKSMVKLHHDLSELPLSVRDRKDARASLKASVALVIAHGLQALARIEAGEYGDN